MFKISVSEKMKEMTLWALWWFVVAGASLWLLVGSVAYWVLHGWLPADAAGWVQAIGSVLALAAAVGVPLWQRFSQQLDRKISQLEQRRASYQQVRYLITEMRSFVNDRDFCDTIYSPYAREIAAKQLDEVVLRLDAIVARLSDPVLLDICCDFRQMLKDLSRFVVSGRDIAPSFKRDLLTDSGELFNNLMAALKNV